MKALTIQKPAFRMTKPMYRFYVFGSRVTEPLTEDKIIRYYKSNVMQFSEKWNYNYSLKKWEAIPFTKSEVRQKGLAWFDRWLGKFIRLQIKKAEG